MKFVQLLSLVACVEAYTTLFEAGSCKDNGCAEITTQTMCSQIMETEGLGDIFVSKKIESSFGLDVQQPSPDKCYYQTELNVVVWNTRKTSQDATERDHKICNCEDTQDFGNATMVFFPNAVVSLVESPFDAASEEVEKCSAAEDHAFCRSKAFFISEYGGLENYCNSEFGKMCPCLCSGHLGETCHARDSHNKIHQDKGWCTSELSNAVEKHGRHGKRELCRTIKNDCPCACQCQPRRQGGRHHFEHEHGARSKSKFCFFAIGIFIFIIIACAYRRGVRRGENLANRIRPAIPGNTPVIMVSACEVVDPNNLPALEKKVLPHAVSVKDIESQLVTGTVITDVQTIEA